MRHGPSPAQALDLLLEGPSRVCGEAAAAPAVLAAPIAIDTTSCESQQPAKVALSPDAQRLPTLLDPRLPAKKMLNFSGYSQAGTQKQFDPYMPLKKQVSESLALASEAAEGNVSVIPTAR